MPSAADRPRDRGLAVERTALAWQRTTLGFTSLAALILGAAAHRQAAWMLGPAAGLFVVAGLAWRYARRRSAAPGAGTDRRALRWLAAATGAAALVAAALALVRAG
jgi:uncharacterized membrane protein YidH (DUF202 family)